eukprot:s1126_g10.t1
MGEELVRYFFADMSEMAEGTDESVLDEFRHAGGNPHSVRDFFIGEAKKVRMDLNMIPRILVVAFGYILSVLLFGTVATQNGAFPAKKENNFKERAEKLLGFGPALLKELQATKIPGLTHNSDNKGQTEVTASDSLSIQQVFDQSAFQHIKTTTYSRYLEKHQWIARTLMALGVC